MSKARADWESSYAGYDDEALALLANPGLVRRAAKLVTGATTSDEGARVGDFEVKLDARGPAHGRCSCVSSGICAHVLAATMLIRDAALTASKEVLDENAEHATEEPAGSDQPNVEANTDYRAALAAVLELDPVATNRRAGIAAVRSVYALDLSLGTLALSGSTTHLDISWGSLPKVRFVVGAGWDGMVSSAEGKKRASLHLEALVRVFTAHNTSWIWPEEKLGLVQGATKAVDFKDFTLEVRRQVEQAVNWGLSHLGDDVSERLGNLAVDAKTASLFVLSSHLFAASSQLSGLALRRDDVSEAEALSVLARTWALTHALDNASEHELPRLLGRARREFTASSDALTLMPLGASWRQTESGARILSLVTWDKQAKELLVASTARPHGVDPGFFRSSGTTALWDTHLHLLLAGSFNIIEPRLSVDGKLSATAKKTSFASPGFDSHLLEDLTKGLSPKTQAVGFESQDEAFALLCTKGFGSITIDEARQELLWTVPISGDVAGGETKVLRQEITPATTHRIDALLTWESVGVKLQFLLIQRRSDYEWEPVAGFIRQQKVLLLECLDFPLHVHAKRLSPLQKRWAMLKKRWKPQLVIEQKPLSAIALLCNDVREFTESLCATGRFVLSEDQQRRGAQIAERCDVLALATLSSLTQSLLKHPSPATALWLHHIADRAALLELGDKS
ncbi:MAG: hypothetical protein FWE41_06410 [Coriobacteriia bacterium]|nr:hypothetical protein [Coriobacteriia bacterium]MCL2750226.1 hypothetical protein [Coriobacteriia bacterium]